jgi:hypothetical protein
MERSNIDGRPIVVGKTATLRGVEYHRSMSAVLKDGDIIVSSINHDKHSQWHTTGNPKVSEWYAKYNNYEGKEWLFACDKDGKEIDGEGSDLGARLWHTPSDFASDHMAYMKPNRVRNINGWDHCKKHVYPHAYSLNVRVVGDMPPPPPKAKKAKECDAEWEAKEKARKQDMEKQAKERERAEKDQARYNPNIMSRTKALVVLGMTDQNTKGEIRKAYLTLARDNHPDKTNGDKDKAVRFREVQEAWDSLCAIYGWN